MSENKLTDRQEFRLLWDELNANCYGSGEWQLIEAFRDLFKSLEDNRHLNYESAYEAVKNEALAWCLILLLDNAGFIECGTSLRHSWITEEGKPFVKFIKEYDVEQLYKWAVELGSRYEP